MILQLVILIPETYALQKLFELRLNSGTFEIRATKIQNCHRARDGVMHRQREL